MAIELPFALVSARVEQTRTATREGLIDFFVLLIKVV